MIENNPTIALKSLVTPREGELERQEILLNFAEGTYVHHRAMRDIWRKLSDTEREQLVPSKSQVNQAFSTSFGLHVAVITADNPPKFLFCRRANRGRCQMPEFVHISRFMKQHLLQNVEVIGLPFLPKILIAHFQVNIQFFQLSSLIS